MRPNKRELKKKVLKFHDESVFSIDSFKLIFLKLISRVLDTHRRTGYA